MVYLVIGGIVVGGWTLLLLVGDERARRVAERAAEARHRAEAEAAAEGAADVVVVKG